MSDTRDSQYEPDAVELLLPWYGTGRLTAEDQRRLDAALAEDAGLRERLALTLEERDEVVSLNERLGTPSRRAAEKVFAAIDAEIGSKPAERAAARRAAASPSWLHRLGDSLARLSPDLRGALAVAACALVLVQAGLLTGFFAARSGLVPQARYETASETAAPAGTGSLALVQLAPEATAAALTDWLAARNAAIVDGPHGGFFTVRISADKLSQADLQAALARLQGDGHVIALALPEP